MNNGKDKYKILIVDDQQIIRMLLRNILEEEGFKNIDEAESGTQAISLYKERLHDIAIVDLIMTNGSGKSATEEILKINPEANIVICTSIRNPDFLKDVKNLGIKAFIHKPFDNSKIVETISKLLKMN
ncbi:MAG: response regulator [Candidatus Helarchaeota archaeon]